MAANSPASGPPTQSVYGSDPSTPAPDGMPGATTAPAYGQAWSPVAPAPTPPPSHPRRSLLLAVVVVVVVVAVLLAALFALGVFKGSSSGGGPGVVGPVSYYAQDVAPAQSVASSQSNGPWTIVAAEGINLTSSISSPSGGDFAGGPDCTYQTAAGAPSTIVLPATPSDAPLGSASAWVFIAAGPGDTLLYILSAEGSTYPMVVGQGSCVTGITSFGALSAISPVNATVIATAAFANGAASFVSSHPGATLTYVLLGAGTGDPSGAWGVEVSTCGFTSSGGTGTIWIQDFDAGSGAAISSTSSQSEAC